MVPPLFNGKIIAIYSSIPQQGKSTIRDYLVGAHKFRYLPFARVLKRMVYTLLIEHGYSHETVIEYIEEKKHEPLNRVAGSPTARELLQTLGTDWGRHQVAMDLWLSEWESKARVWSRSGTSIVADDLRFPNEAEAVTRLGGKIWRVERPDMEELPCHSHSSEGNLDSLKFDQVYNNDGTIEDLVKKVRQGLKYTRARKGDI
jgi:hypothetical protein